MSDLWLPPGAQPFDEEVEAAIEASADPAEMRAAAEGLREQGFSFPATGLGNAVTPDSAVVLIADRWFRFENAKGERPLTAMVKSDELERMLLDSTLEYENAAVAQWAEQPLLNALCPALVVRLKPFQTFTPLFAPDRPSAPDDWKTVVAEHGCALAIEQEDERFLYFSTGPMANVDGLVLPERSREKPGRNDRCPCGSGIKYKRCCGR